MRGTDGGGWYQGAVDSELVAQLREEIENKAEHIKVATAFHGLPQILRNQWQCAAFLVQIVLESLRLVVDFGEDADAMSAAFRP